MGDYAGDTDTLSVVAYSGAVETEVILGSDSDTLASTSGFTYKTLTATGSPFLSLSVVMMGGNEVFLTPCFTTISRWRYLRYQNLFPY